MLLFLKPAFQTEIDEFPITTDISFNIESDNNAEYQIMEKVVDILGNKRITTPPRWNPIKPGFSGFIKTTKEELGEKSVFHFMFTLEEISCVIF